jgi:hypothetical protein
LLPCCLPLSLNRPFLPARRLLSQEVFARLIGRKPAPTAAAVPDPLSSFTEAWEHVKVRSEGTRRSRRSSDARCLSPPVQETLEHPDERMLSRGISSTQVPQQLQAMVDALVHESNETDDR